MRKRNKQINKSNTNQEKPWAEENIRPEPDRDSLVISRRDFLKITVSSMAGAKIGSSVSSSPLARSFETKKIFDKEMHSCCPFCQVRCTTKVQVKDGRVVNVYGNPENFWTKGGMCAKGQALIELTYSPHRLLYPLKREGTEWRRISYEEALEIVANKLIEVKTKYPEDYAHRVVLFAPLWDSRESELMAILALHLAGFPDICYPGETCIGNSGAALEMCLGSPITPTTIDEILNTRLLILWGMNVAEIYPPYVRWVDEARSKGVRIVYIDPRRTPTTNHCDLQLSMRPGTDGAFALGLIRLLIKERLYDATYVKKYVNGFEELSKCVDFYTPERVEEITGLRANVIVDFAHEVAGSEKTIVWLGGSLSRYSNAINTVRAIIALQAIKGNLSGSGKGIMSVQAGKPGGGEAFHEKYRPQDLAPPLGFRKILYNMERGRVDLLLLNSSYRRYPDTHRVEQAIKKVGLVVYRGFFMDDEAKLAHLIIPSTMAFESSGSQYGAQRQVVWRERVIAPIGETVEDWRFYRDLGRRINKEKFPSVDGPEEIYELFRSLSPTWQGLTMERIKNNPTGICWPCTSSDHPGTRGTLYEGNRFWTRSGKVELRSSAVGPVGWSAPKGSPREGSAAQDFPFIFLQGKVAHHWQQTYTNWSSYMAQFSEGNYVQVHPDSVKPLGIKDGDEVYLETEKGRIKVRVKLSQLIMPGVVWTPSHPAASTPFKGNRGDSINKIIPGYWDEVAAQFNGFGCRLTKL